MLGKIPLPFVREVFSKVYLEDNRQQVMEEVGSVGTGCLGLLREVFAPNVGGWLARNGLSSKGVGTSMAFLKGL